LQRGLNMPFPIIPAVATLAAALGIGTLWWYYNLSREQQSEADEMAIDIARDLYDKTVHELSLAEKRRVYDLVRARFN
jgi:hypothetical protein